MRDASTNTDFNDEDDHMSSESRMSSGSDDIISEIQGLIIVIVSKYNNVNNKWIKACKDYEGLLFGMQPKQMSNRLSYYNAHLKSSLFYQMLLKEVNKQIKTFITTEN